MNGQVKDRIWRTARHAAVGAPGRHPAVAGSGYHRVCMGQSGLCVLHRGRHERVNDRLKVAAVHSDPRMPD